MIKKKKGKKYTHINVREKMVKKKGNNMLKQITTIIYLHRYKDEKKV